MDDEPATAEDLVRELMKAGATETHARRWVTNRTALLSGLVPGDAVADPRSAARVLVALRRYIARLPEPVPDGVEVTGVRIREPGTFLLELNFAWPGGTAVRHWDAEPYLWASRAHEPLLTDYPRFARLHVSNRTLTWPAVADEQELDFSPELLFGESWTPAQADEQPPPGASPSP